MLRGFSIDNGRLRQLEDATVYSACQWFDLLAPDEEERSPLNLLLG